MAQIWKVTFWLFSTGTLGSMVFAIQQHLSRGLEIHCALKCRASLKCGSFYYHRHNTIAATSGFEGNCALLPKPKQDQLNLMVPIPEGFDHTLAIVASKSVAVFQRAPVQNIRAIARSLGFNISLILGNGTVFLKRIPGEFRPQEASFHCFSHGGILPVEDSDEFIQAMSALVGNASATRLISLQSEKVDGEATRYLVWILGQVEHGEGELDHPKFVNWPSDNFDSRYFVINPGTKTYQPLLRHSTKNNVYCQLLGENLATGKKALASSWAPDQPPERALDGNIFGGWRGWHSHLNSKSRPDWIAVDLGRVHAIQHVMFIGRSGPSGKRIKMVTVWAGFIAPQNNNPFNSDDFTQCSHYPYQQRWGYLSGVTCHFPTAGRYVAVVNYDSTDVTHLEELGVFGYPL